jgi:hypothetical protein
VIEVRMGVILLGLAWLWVVACAVERGLRNAPYRWVVGVILMIVSSTVTCITAGAIGGDSDAWFAGALIAHAVTAAGLTLWGARRAGLGVRARYPDWMAVRIAAIPTAVAAILLIGLPASTQGSILPTAGMVLVAGLLTGSTWFFIRQRPGLPLRGLSATVSIANLLLGWLAVSVGATYWTFLLAVALGAWLITSSEFRWVTASAVSSEALATR